MNWRKWQNEDKNQAPLPPPLNSALCLKIIVIIKNSIGCDIVILIWSHVSFKLTTYSTSIYSTACDVLLANFYLLLSLVLNISPLPGLLFVCQFDSTRFTNPVTVFCIFPCVTNPVCLLLVTS